MKNKIISVALALVLVFALSATAFAAGGHMKPTFAGGAKTSQTGGAKAAQTGDPAVMRDLMKTAIADRVTLLKLEASNRELAAQLKSILAGIKESGGTLAQDTLDQLKTIKDQLATLKDKFAATKGQLDSLMASYKHYKQSKDFENASAVLKQVIALQQDRISTKTSIGTLTQQMIDILKSAAVIPAGSATTGDTGSTGDTSNTGNTSSTGATGTTGSESTGS